MSGIPFDYSRKWGPYSPSFHQQKPGRGYHYSNLKIIAFGLNMALGSWSVGEAERLMIEGDALAQRGDTEDVGLSQRADRNLSRAPTPELEHRFASMRGKLVLWQKQPSPSRS
jgi:hypothetical protein